MRGLTLLAADERTTDRRAARHPTVRSQQKHTLGRPGPPTGTAGRTAHEARDRVSGHAAARLSALARAAIAPYAQPTPIEIPIPAEALPIGDDAPTPIVPVLVGDSARAVARAVAQAAALRAHGVFVQPMIAPPVPEHGARLRFFLSCEHTDAQIDAAVAALFLVHRSSFSAFGTNPE